MSEFLGAMSKVTVIGVFACTFCEIFADLRFIPLAFWRFLGMGKLAISALLTTICEIEFAGNILVLLLAEEVFDFPNMTNGYFFGR